MNYTTTNREFRESVLELIGTGFTNATKINLGVSYSQNRKLSIVMIEVSPSPIIHSLIFFYTRGLELHDVLCYRQKRFIRVNRSGDAFENVDRINRYLLKHLPKASPIAPKKIDEQTGRNRDVGIKDEQIQRLKDRIRIHIETNRSLRNQIKFLKDRTKPY
jgi:hypothetical protein